MRNESSLFANFSVDFVTISDSSFIKLVVNEEDGSLKNEILGLLEKIK
jgi:hypothetical protein